MRAICFLVAAVTAFWLVGAALGDAVTPPRPPCRPGGDCSVRSLSVDGGVTVGSQPLIGSSSVVLYVDPANAGSDSNPCTSGGSGACATFQGACSKLPLFPESSIIVIADGGTYSGMCDLSQTTMGNLAGVPSQVTFQGQWKTATVATGSATGTATAGTAGTGTASGTLSDSTQSWTANDLRGKWATITTGTGAGQRFDICANTATQLTACGQWTAPDTSSSYAIQVPATIINGNAGLYYDDGANCGANATCATQATSTVGLLVAQPWSQRANSAVRVTAIDFTGGMSRGIGLISGGLTVDHCQFDAALTTGVRYYGSSGLTITDSTFTPASTAVVQSVGGMGSAVKLARNFMNVSTDVTLQGFNALAYFGFNTMLCPGSNCVRLNGTANAEFFAETYSGTICLRTQGSAFGRGYHSKVMVDGSTFSCTAFNMSAEDGSEIWIDSNGSGSTTINDNGSAPTAILNGHITYYPTLTIQNEPAAGGWNICDASIKDADVRALSPPKVGCPTTRATLEELGAANSTQLAAATLGPGFSLAPTATASLPSCPGPAPYDAGTYVWDSTTSQAKVCDGAQYQSLAYAPVSIANGGTGNGSLAVTAGGLLYTDGTRVQNSGAGTGCVKGNGSSAPSIGTCFGSGSEHTLTTIYLNAAAPASLTVEGGHHLGSNFTVTHFTGYLGVAGAVGCTGNITFSATDGSGTCTGTIAANTAVGTYDTGAPAGACAFTTSAPNLIFKITGAGGVCAPQPVLINIDVAGYTP
jgi:hypothetical protein